MKNFNGFVLLCAVLFANVSQANICKEDAPMSVIKALDDHRIAIICASTRDYYPTIYINEVISCLPVGRRVEVSALRLNDHQVCVTLKVLN